MNVRKIKESDLDQLLLLYGHLHEDDDKISMESLKKIWGEIFSNEAFTYFVIELDGMIVCSCNVSIIPNLTRGGRSIAIIENVVTHANFRKRGLGKLIIETAIDFAKTKNCYKVMLMTSKKRKGAHEFYRQLGFSSEEKIGFTMKLE